MLLEDPGRDHFCYVSGTLTSLDGHIATIEPDEPEPCIDGPPVDLVLWGEAEEGQRYLFKLPQTAVGRPWAVERPLPPEAPASE